MSLVYFLQCAETKKIKIGHAGDVSARTKEIQRFSPTELRVIALANGGFRREQELHKRFAAIRSHGEWFYPSYPLLKFIEIDAAHAYNEAALIHFGEFANLNEIGAAA